VFEMASTRREETYPVLTCDLDPPAFALSARRPLRALTGQLAGRKA
jgi:hypothetical protein